MKNLKKKSLSPVLAGLTLAGLAMTVDAADVSSKSGKAGAVHQISSTPWEGEEHLKLTSVWDKTFPESDKVDHTKVTFHNRYGITLAADLYMPRNRQGRMPALAVAGPFGAVKEQAAGIYAQKLAEMGFITMAFDPSFIGESGGNVRNVASPDINTKDFCAAVDYLSNRSDVNPDKIGILGICGFGGMALNAAAIDTRIKATVTSTMYDMSRVTANGYFDYEKDSDTLKKERMERISGPAVWWIRFRKMHCSSLRIIMLIIREEHTIQDLQILTMDGTQPVHFHLPICLSFPMQMKLKIRC